VQPVLVALRALGLGDLLTAVPALRALADAFPGHRRVLAAPRALTPLALLTGTVDGVVPAVPLAPLPRALHGPDLAVNLHGRGPESHRVLAELNPGRTIAFANPGEGVTGPRWRADEHEVARWCRLLSESGVPADPSRLGIRAPPVAVPDLVRGATVVHPGAASASRRWPAERFAAVARAERAAGRTVVVTGGRDEIPLARRVATGGGLPGAAVLAGRTCLLELAAVVAAAGRVVCGDTGVSHLATALGTPSVTLFGPVSPRLWGPPADRPRHRALWAGREGDPHADHPDPGLLRLGVPDVVEALASLPEPAVSR
jgi:ADP-heptose:LPS heptosyltransferase